MKDSRSRLSFWQNLNEKRPVPTRKAYSGEMAVAIASGEDSDRRQRPLLTMASKGCHGEGGSFHIIPKKFRSQMADYLVYERSEGRFWFQSIGPSQVINMDINCSRVVSYGFLGLGLKFILGCKADWFPKWFRGLVQ